jgi:hypothetical protein
MPLRPRLLLPAVGLVIALASGCSDGGASARTPGDHVSADEATVLADLLHQDLVHGGADFTETAPFAEGAVLTLTGTVDFAHGRGQAQAVTTYQNGQQPESRRVFFTGQEIWLGGVPDLAPALAAAGLPAAEYVQQPLEGTGSSATPSLIDVVVQLVLRLSAQKSDDVRAFRTGDYTWQGSRSIDGRLASEYRLASGATVAVGTADKLLLQYVTPLPGQQFSVTITLPRHGARTVELPPASSTVDLAAHPEVAAKLGL